MVKVGLGQENGLNRAKYTQGNRETFFFGRRPHFFLAFIDSSYSVSNVYEKEMKILKIVGFTLGQSCTWTLIEQNTHKAIEKLFFLGDDPTLFWHS